MLRPQSLLNKTSGLPSWWATRLYSHGATVGEVYGSYRKIDGLMARLRPDQCCTVQEVDSMLNKGEITPIMAEHFKREINMINEAKRTADYWRKILWYIGIPLTLLVGVNTYFLEKEHDEHLNQHPHEITPYPHLRIRSKKFFFGDGEHTPFHNPKVNGP